MAFDALALLLLARCWYALYCARGRFFHDQAWSAWMVFASVSVVWGIAHVWQPGETSGGLIFLAVVSLWIAIELSVSNAGRTVLETHNGLKRDATESQTRETLKRQASSPHTPTGSKPPGSRRRSHA